MLIGKTDPFIAVFTKGERSEPWSLVGTTGTRRHLRCVAPTRARSGSFGAACSLRAVTTRFGAGNRGTQAAQRARVLTPSAARRGADVLPKTTAPEFKKPVLVDFFFEESQLLRFQVLYRYAPALACSRLAVWR